jgi:hypothetical protein
MGLMLMKEGEFPHPKILHHPLNRHLLWANQMAGIS